MNKLGFVETFLLNEWMNFIFPQNFSLFLHRFCVFCFLFFCFTVPCECHCTKSAIFQITMCCDLKQVWHVKEQVCKLFKVCQHEFANLSLLCEGRLMRQCYSLVAIMIFFLSFSFSWNLKTIIIIITIFIQEAHFTKSDIQWGPVKQ